MAKKTLPTIEMLHKLLRYDPEAGLLFWRDRTPDMFCAGKRSKLHSCNNWNSKYSGKEAFAYIDVEGYKAGAIFNVKLRAHRVIWAMVTGEWPGDQIDHINHDRADNRFSNLRDVTCLDNSRNRSGNFDSNSGVYGVTVCKESGRWMARIKIKNKSVHLGMFERLSDAISARKRAEKNHGFHENHGS